MIENQVENLNDPANSAGNSGKPGSNPAGNYGKPGSTKPGHKNQGKKTFKYCKRGGKNDVSWYSKYPQLLKDAANLPWSTILGLDLDLGDVPTINAVPGIMSVNINPSVGKTTNNMDTVNIIAAKDYTFLRHANSGATNYDPADLMMYYLGLGSCYAFAGWMSRLYGICRTYNARNRYWSKGLIESMNVDFDDLLGHVNDLRGTHNTYVSQVNSFSVPKAKSYFSKMAWIQSGVYKDAESEKAQMYYFNFNYYLVYGAFNEDRTWLVPSHLVPTILTGTGDNGKILYKDIVAFSQTLINSLLNNSDIQTMSGDVLKAYGKENLWQISEISEDYVVMPTKEESVLCQIMNSHAIGNLKALPASTPEFNDYLASGYVLQQNGIIQANPVTEIDLPNSDKTFSNLAGYVQNENVILNSRNDVNTVEYNVEASRLASFAKTVTFVEGSSNPLVRSKLQLSDIICDLFMVANYTIYRYHMSTSGSLEYTLEGVTSNSYFCVAATSTGVISSFVGNIFYIIQQTQFDWAPLIYEIDAIGVGAPAALLNDGIIGDLDNYTTFSKDTLERMHFVALYSEYSTF